MAGRRKARKRRKRQREKHSLTKEKIISELEGKEVRTRETFGCWAAVKNGKIEPRDLPLSNYSRNALLHILRFGSRRRRSG